jgi:uncharacterized membrane protein YhaH (DUF805 family)
MKHLFTSDGRISRSTLWFFWIGMFGYFFLLGALERTVALPAWVDTLTTILMFPIIFWGIIFQAKRWHDLDTSGWWVLINIIPLAGLYTLVMCGFVKGTPGPNRFGPNPLGVESSLDE